MTLNHLRNYLSLLRVKVGVGLYFPWWLRRSKNLPAVQETRIRSLGWEHPLEKGMATHSSILGPWVHGSMGPKEYSWSMGPEESDTTELLTHIPGLGSVCSFFRLHLLFRKTQWILFFHVSQNTSFLPFRILCPFVSSAWKIPPDPHIAGFFLTFKFLTTCCLLRETSLGQTI